MNNCNQCGADISHRSKQARYCDKRCHDQAFYQRNHQSLTDRRRPNDRANNLLKKYGMSVAEYDEMHYAQQGCCAICETPETLVRGGRVIRLSVDHCHDTGRIRALLCNFCNTALGKMKDNAALLRRAAAYVEEYA